MWYFSWVLGLGLACSFAIPNVMWFELQQWPLRGRKSHSRRVG
jgi:cyd operon protein YbgT